jgi:uncharacterized membrane protein YoaK (UPF0700 family)
MKNYLSPLLSFNGGYVDTASFLVLHGLFAAHVTGNFVTLAASLSSGTEGAWGKLTALPIFCAVVLLVRGTSGARILRNRPQLSFFLAAQLLLLVLAAMLGVKYGPFDNVDTAPALTTGAVLVAAMAIQNAIHRIYLSSTPPTTLMTGSTTQIMIDVVDMARGVPQDPPSSRDRRFRALSASVLSFTAGCGLAALLYVFSGPYCFFPPCLIALLAYLVQRSAAIDAPAKKP